MLRRVPPAWATYLRPPKRGLRVGGSRSGEGRGITPYEIIKGSTGGPMEIHPKDELKRAHFCENAAESPAMCLPALYHARFRACQQTGAGVFTPLESPLVGPLEISHC